MIIWGFGKVTKKMIGAIGMRACNYCNTEGSWQLCIMRTWFTLFFIPLIPYSKKYCIACPNCGSFVKLTKEEFLKVKASVESGLAYTPQGIATADDTLKYSGKNDVQINYLKEMEKANQ